MGTRFGPQKWDPKPYSFLFQFPVTFQPNFEQSLYLTKKWEPNRSSFWAPGSIPNIAAWCSFLGPVRFLAQFVFTGFGLQSFAGWLAFFGWRVAFCGHFWSEFLAPFLVPVFGTRLPPNIRIIIQPQISGPSFGHPFWSPKMGPKTVQFSVPISGHMSTQF